MTKRRSNLDSVLNDQKDLSIQESKRRGRPYLWGLMAACVVASGLVGVAQADDALVGKLTDAGLPKEGAVRASKLIDDKKHNVCTVLVSAILSKEVFDSEAIRLTGEACSSSEISLEDKKIKIEEKIDNRQKEFNLLQGRADSL